MEEEIKNKEDSEEETYSEEEKEEIRKRLDSLGYL